MSWVHVLPEITGILPALGGSFNYPEEEEFPTLAGLQMPLKNSLDTEHITQRLYFQAIQPTR